MTNSGVKGCSFLLGASGMMVLALAGELPKDVSTYTVRATPTTLTIKAGLKEVASFAFSNDEVFQELSKLSNIGVVEYVEGQPVPGQLTNMAYVETMRLAL